MVGPRCFSWAEPRAILLILLVVVVLCLPDCEAARKKKPCKYNRKKYKPGEVIASVEDNCAEIRCSEKGKKIVLQPMKNCVCDKEGGCLPTISCSLLGGHCVKYRRKCDGTVDPWGCRGGKKCKCCIPDQTTPAPLTPCPTFATTTPGVTVNPALTWLSVGSDRFVQFSQPMDWFAARSLCQDNGLQLYHPTNITAVAIYLEDNFSDDYYWLGAKGNGTHQVWADGEVLTWTDPWYNPARHFNNGTNDCLGVITFSASLAASGTVLLTTPGSCTGRTDMKVLCG